MECRSETDVIMYIYTKLKPSPVEHLNQHKKKSFVIFTNFTIQKKRAKSSSYYDVIQK